MKIAPHARFALAVSVAVVASGMAWCRPANADAHNVTVHVEFLSQKKHGATHRKEQAVVWLSSLEAAQPAENWPARHATYRIVQKNKEFIPHLLVIPVNSVVEFPNQDPFFHNVFSMFDGKRFDLGLYEAGSTRGVRFNREGVSYIFCNIHPQMSAVILALDTPYYAISNAVGQAIIRNVPSGDYRLHVWAEHADQQTVNQLAQTVHVNASKNNEPLAVAIPLSADAGFQHKNKYGQDYPPAPTSLY
jgi:plastocyanin